MFAQPRTFRCAHCKEVVNDSMDVCPFCGGAIDREAASAAAEVQDKVNQAYSDASYMRTAAIAMFVFLGLSFVPLIPVVYWGFLVTFIVVIVMVIRWQVKFGNLKTDDPDYRQAGYRKNLSLVLWLLAIPAGFVLHPTITAVVNQMLFQR
jgi:hypothetical protein